MSTAIRVNRLVDGKVESDETDRPEIFRHAARLDVLCQRAGVIEFSRFFDTTDLTFNAGNAGLPAGVASTWELVARDGEWFMADQGLETLDALIRSLREAPQRFGLLSNRYRQVLDELESCRESIRECAELEVRFHLCVVS